MQVSVDAIHAPDASEEVTIFAAQSLLRKVPCPDPATSVVDLLISLKTDCRVVQQGACELGRSKSPAVLET